MSKHGVSTDVCTILIYEELTISGFYTSMVAISNEKFD